jgi:hypothetical protein
MRPATDLSFVFCPSSSVFCLLSSVIAASSRPDCPADDACFPIAVLRICYHSFLKILKARGCVVRGFCLALPPVFLNL